MKRFAPALCALWLMGCPRMVPREDAGPGRTDAGPLEVDAGDPAVNDFTGEIVFNDNALRALDPSTLPAGSAPCRQPVLVLINFVVDGDTISVRGQNAAFNGLVRLIGVDTPEIAHDGMPADCYGPDAARFSEKLDEHLAWLTFDNECFDNFDRSLAYVHVGADEGGFWQRQLLRRGFATEFHVGANTAFRSTFEDDETAAATANAGLWDACR